MLKGLPSKWVGACESDPWQVFRHLTAAELEAGNDPMLQDPSGIPLIDFRWRKASPAVFVGNVGPNSRKFANQKQRKV
jgi:hypothetical protein